MEKDHVETFHYKEANNLQHLWTYFPLLYS